MKSAFALLFLLLVGFSNCSFAQGVPDDIMINTLQCEAGKIGRKLQQAHLPTDKTMIVTWKDSETNSGGFGGGFKIPLLDVGASGDVSKEQLDELSSDGLSFNLHPDNYAVCAGYKKQIILEGVGAYPCLGEKKYATLAYVLSTKIGSTGCHYKITLGKKLSGSLQIPVWGPVTVGPEGSYGDTTVYDIVLAAPPKKGGDSDKDK